MLCPNFFPTLGPAIRTHWTFKHFLLEGTKFMSLALHYQIFSSIRWKGADVVRYDNIACLHFDWGVWSVENCYKACLSFIFLVNLHHFYAYTDRIWTNGRTIFSGTTWLFSQFVWDYACPAFSFICLFGNFYLYIICNDCYAWLFGQIFVKRIWCLQFFIQCIVGKGFRWYSV